MTYSLVSAKSIQSFTSSGPLATALRAIHTLMVAFCHLGIFLKRYHNENNTKSSLYNLPSLIHVLLNTFPIYHVRFSGLIWLSHSLNSETPFSAISKIFFCVNIPKNSFVLLIHFQINLCIFSWLKVNDYLHINYAQGHNFDGRKLSENSTFHHVSIIPRNAFFAKKNGESAPIPQNTQNPLYLCFLLSFQMRLNMLFSPSWRVLLVSMSPHISLLLYMAIATLSLP